MADVGAHCTRSSFTVRDDKSTATMTDLAGNYCGVIVADALSTHEAGARARPGIVLAGSHPDAEQMVVWIGQLYEIDASVNDETRLWDHAELKSLFASRFYTILETCKLHAVNPAAYLHAAVLAADRGEAVLPWDFATASSH